ncbi:hypothetical protein QX233_13325 [Chryseobacterium gambrini]|uniref:YobI-like P-loop NTPase domain-containing protein n=2 Tax=Chryseobacterium gambrini TaxID=373672 RepID=A0AAJ1R709_9FLAO|nr:hypothetical protein [Chryseobacterium sp. ZHDP1]MDN4013452.1 hypothetical protein [Chryseobacterium gambrini]QWA37791.1 hypothetical protein KKI44_18005 [Chryseobacterium sp. ZHDP1]
MTEIYFNALSKAIFSLGKRKNKILTKNNPNYNHLEDLTPFIVKEDEDNYNLKTYLESIRWGILNQNVKNIAISGSFGTGKSTILNLFKKNNPEFKTLDISLGKFEKNEQKEIDIETSIVQQILYFEKKRNLKDSRFERINNDRFILLKAILFIIWIYSILYIFFDKIYNKLILTDKIEFSYYHLLIKFIFLTGFFLILKKLFRQIFKLKINKISFSDAEFVPKEHNDISIINKHIDELIYFFEKTKTQVVFIEDIDRFESAAETFIKLRELNILINNSKDILQKVTFVYAVKDELFSRNDEKTKFFDLIIPIIPIIDYSNSSTQFIKRLKKDFIENNIISEDIIYDIAPYINDMRSLINIINEFRTYYKIKFNENSDINGNSLFSLVVLKNIYPNEFKCLQNKQGVIYSIFQNKIHFYSELKAILENKISDLKIENKAILNEQQDNIQELRKLYLYEILLLSKNANIYYLGDSQIEFKDLLTTESFERMVELNAISHYHIRKEFLRFSDIEAKVSPKPYKERKQVIIHKSNNKLKNNEITIDKIQAEINNLKNSSIYQLFQKSERAKIDNYFDDIFNSYKKLNIEQKPSLETDSVEEEFSNEIEVKKMALNEISDEETNLHYSLLKVLITNKYVDENYSTYVSLFYPESISEKDNNLKLRIIQDGITDFNESIDKTKNFISELGSNNFKKESVLNFYILDYLLINYRDNENISSKLDEFIVVLSSEKDKSVQFIEKYIEFSDLNGTIIEFVRKISIWEGFWNLIYSREEFTIEKKRRVLDIIMKYLDIETIKLLNKEKKINTFLNNYDDFLLNNFEKETKEKLIDKLKVLGVKFNKIKYGDIIFEIVIKVIEYNLYKINISNINLFLEKVNSQNIDLDYKTANYSYLLQSSVTYLKQNINNNNINEYVEQVLLKLENNTEEEINVVVSLINNSNVKPENVDLLIEKLNFKLSNISEIENSTFWSTLMIEKKIEPSWKNVLLYYKSKSEEIDDVLIEFLNFKPNFEILSDKCIDHFLNEEEEIVSDTIERFNISLVNSAISEESFNNLVHSMTKNFDDASVIEKSSRINILIDNDLIVFNNKNLSELHGKDLELFVEKNEEELKNSYDSLVLLIYTWITILTSNISGFLKKQIFDHLTQDKSYSSEDEMFLIKVLINFYEQKFHSFSEYFLNCIVKSTLKQYAKIRYLNFDKEYISDQLMNESIKLIGNPYSKVLNKEKFELPNTEENAEALRNLQQMGYIKRTYLRDKDSKITVSYHD